MAVYAISVFNKPLRYLAEGWLFIVVYVALDWASTVHASRFGFSAFNPEAALALAFLVWRGLRQIPHVVLAIFWASASSTLIGFKGLQGLSPRASWRPGSA